MTKESEKSIYYTNIRPIYQAAFVLCAILVFDLLVFVMKAVGFSSLSKDTPWLIFASFMLFYALINGILSISASKPNNYWMQSIGLYVVLLIFGCLLSYLFSGMTINEAGSYRWLLILFTFCYILILSITRAMKKIVKIAQKQDKSMRGEE